MIWIFAPLLALPLVISAFWWMGAPTKRGRAIMDRIAGFEQYLSITEEERFEALHPPEKTPELFERYLPYAIALDVENSWAHRFAGVLAAAAADPTRQDSGNDLVFGIEQPVDQRQRLSPQRWAARWRAASLRPRPRPDRAAARAAAVSRAAAEAAAAAAAGEGDDPPQSALRHVAQDAGDPRGGRRGRHRRSNISRQPPSKAELRAALRARRASARARGCAPRSRSPPNSACWRARSAKKRSSTRWSPNPILIERPLVETEKGVRLCRPQDKVREIL